MMSIAMGQSKVEKKLKKMKKVEEKLRKVEEEEKTKKVEIFLKMKD